MSDEDDLIEFHNAAVRRLAEHAMAHIRHENVEEALARLEEAVAACENHPAFARLAESPCNTVPQIIALCMRLTSKTGPVGTTAQGLLERMHRLGGTPIH